MNPEEKKERIDYLWDKVRMHVKTMGAIGFVQQKIDSQFLDQFAQESQYDIEQAKEGQQ